MQSKLIRALVAATAIGAASFLTPVDVSARGGGGHGGGWGGGGRSFGGWGGGARSFGGWGGGARSIHRSSGGGYARRSISSGRSYGVARSRASAVARSYHGGRSVTRAHALSSNQRSIAHASAAGHMASAARMISPVKTISHANNVMQANAAGRRAISNIALRSTFARANVFHGKFHGLHGHLLRRGIVIGWIGSLFWPYAYDDFFDYVFWPYAYDDFWPYAYDDVYQGIYGGYAYAGSGVKAGQVRTGAVEGARRPTVGICTESAPELTNWPIDRISQIVDPAEAQRAALDDLKSATAKAIDILKAACPDDLPSIPTGRLTAMEDRLQIMLQAVQTVRPALDRFYQLLSDEQKARFNAIAPATDQAAAAEDQRDLSKCAASARQALPIFPLARLRGQFSPPRRSRACSRN
jgi:hypothetical protein